MYALISLGRLHEALEEGERLLQMHRTSGARTGEAKTLADTAEILIKLGLLDEGLHRLANATRLLESIPRGNVRYISAMSSVSEAARAAELYELADEVSAFAVESFTPGTDQRAAAELQRAELLLEWGPATRTRRLVEEANVRFARSVNLVRYWVQNHFHDAPLATVLYALGLVKIGAVEEALTLADSLIVPLRDNGHEHEARLAHLAYGIALRLQRAGSARPGDEFLAADGYGPAEPAAAELPVRARGARRQPSSPATPRVRCSTRARARPPPGGCAERRMLPGPPPRRLEAPRARPTATSTRRSTGSATAGESPATRRAPRHRLGRRIDDRLASHIVGDRVLREIAAILRAHCRPEDVAVASAATSSPSSYGPTCRPPPASANASATSSPAGTGTRSRSACA